MQYDVTEYILASKPTLKIGPDKVVEIDNDFRTVYAILDVANDTKITDLERIEKILNLGLGKEVANELLAQNYQFPVYGKIVSCIIASISGEEVDKVEENKKRFQK